MPSKIFASPPKKYAIPPSFSRITSLLSQGYAFPEIKKKLKIGPDYLYRYQEVYPEKVIDTYKDRILIAYKNGDTILKIKSRFQVTQAIVDQCLASLPAPTPIVKKTTLKKNIPSSELVTPAPVSPPESQLVDIYSVLRNIQKKALEIVNNLQTVDVTVKDRNGNYHNTKQFIGIDDAFRAMQRLESQIKLVLDREEQMHNAQSMDFFKKMVIEEVNKESTGCGKRIVSRLHKLMQLFQSVDYDS